MGRQAPGVYVPLDANYLRDPAIRKAGPDAELLYLRGLAHAKSGDTEGVILAYDLPVIAVGLRAVPRRVDALVRECLWETIPDGWYIRSWEKWNLTREERAAVKESKRAGAILTNHNRYHKNDSVPDCPHCSGSHQRSLERPVERSLHLAKGREGK